MSINEFIFEGNGCDELAKKASEMDIGHCYYVLTNSISFFCNSLASAKKIIKQLQESLPEGVVSGTFRLSIAQNFVSKIPKPSPESIQAMQDYVDKRVKELDINVYAISKTSCGHAYFKARKIKIPKVKDVDTFCICLHEIGHILNGYIEPVYLSEYHTEQQALRQAHEYADSNNISENSDWKRALYEYEKRAKGYVIWHIAKGYKAGLRVKKILPEVKKWLQYDFNTWPGNTVEVKRFTNGYCVNLNSIK